MVVDDGGLVQPHLPPGVEKQLTAIIRQTGTDIVAIRAHLERQFDETM